MKKMLLTAVLLLAVASSATAQEWFDFNGQALQPTAVGNDLTMYSVVNNNGVIAAPFLLDFANFEYTLVITGMTLDFAMPPFQWLYSGGTMTIYEDNGTAADYANPSTFTDGTAILVGDMTTFEKLMFSSTIGSGTGLLTWTGGTRLGDISPGQLSGWRCNVSISNRSTVVVPGYDEQWDGKVEFVPVGTESSSFGKIKAQY